MMKDWTPEEVADFEHGKLRAISRAWERHAGAVEDADFEHLLEVIGHYRCLLAAAYKIGRQNETIIRHHRNEQASLLRNLRSVKLKVHAIKQQLNHIRHLFEEYKNARA